MRKAASLAPADLEAPAVVHDTLRSAGQPLDRETRAFMEPRFGRDLSKVRIHSDERAAQSAQSINAHAYTVGSNIAFGSGRFSPGTHEGRHLLAHELAHVVQQSSMPSVVQRFASCIVARPSTLDCPSRETGEVNRARNDGMIFVGVHDGNQVANFDIGKATVKPNLKDSIFWKQFIDKIAHDTSHWAMLGFSDCEGNEKSNLSLREQRAQAIFNILPPGVQKRVDSHRASPESQCITDNTTPADRLLNRGVLFQYLYSDADFGEEKVDPTPNAAVDTEDCSPKQKADLVMAFRFAKLMLDKSVSALSSVAPGSVEERLLVKYFGTDALKEVGTIRRGFRRIQERWNPDLTFRCQTAADTPHTEVHGKYNVQVEGDCESTTEGYTGALAVLTSGHLSSILICDYAFTKHDLPETILHEIGHALEWKFDEGYCSRSSGCGLETSEAINNADSYSGFAGELIDLLGP